MSTLDSPSFERPRRMAICQHVRLGFYTTLELQPHNFDNPNWMLEEYVRLSEWIDVTFTPLSAEEVVGTAMVALNAARESIVNEFADKLAEIDGRIANLRCLPAPSTVSDEV